MRRTTRATRSASRIDTAAQDTVRNRDVKPSSAVLPESPKNSAMGLDPIPGYKVYPTLVN